MTSAKPNDSPPNPSQAAPAAGRSKSEGHTDKELPVELARRLEQLDGDDWGAFDRTVAGWFAENPQEMITFLEGSPRRDQILGTAMILWAEKNSEAASTWLAAHPGVPGRDAMAAGLAAAVVKDDPDAAVQWVASITSPEMKSAAAQKAGYEFFSQSEAAAREALTKMGMPDSFADVSIRESWNPMLDARARRMAQNIASTRAAAMAAGAELTAGSIEEVIKVLSQGVQGSGGFSTMTFKVDPGSLTEREQAAMKGYLKFSGEDLIFEHGTAGETP